MGEEEEEGNEKERELEGGVGGKQSDQDDNRLPDEL